MTDRIVDLAAERARRRRSDPQPTPDAAGTGEAIGLMGLAASAWLVGWVKLWTSMWGATTPLIR